MRDWRPNASPATSERDLTIGLSLLQRVTPLAVLSNRVGRRLCYDDKKRDSENLNVS